MMIDFSSIKLQNPGLLYARLVPGSTASEDFRKGHSNYYSCNANRILLLLLLAFDLPGNSLDLLKHARTCVLWWRQAFLKPALNSTIIPSLSFAAPPLLSSLFS